VHFVDVVDYFVGCFCEVEKILIDSRVWVEYNDVNFLVLGFFFIGFILFVFLCLVDI
jgi:hypothetical protein